MTDRQGWRAVRSAIARRRVAVHGTTFFGAAAVGCALLVIVSGILVALFFVPSSDLVRYDGPYQPLVGAEMSRAYRSLLHLTFEVEGGLLLRQTHHWASLILPALLGVQLAAIWFTGRNRRPGRLSWLLLCGAMGAALLSGWSGYGLPDDLLAGTGLRIFQGILLGIPFVGTRLATLVFGDGFPGHIIEVLAPIHFIIAPSLLIAFLIGRAVIAWRMPGPRRSPEARGVRVREVALLRIVPVAVAVACATAGAVVLIASAVTVSPIWVSGPSDPGSATAASQPDWYTAFLDGALRLVPSGWEVEIGGGTVTLALLVPLAVVGVFVAAIVAVPALEDTLRRDRGFHRVIERPRDFPGRTGLGAAVIAFYLVLSTAAASDVIAQQFRLNLESVIGAHQVALFVAPLGAFLLVRRVCLDLRARDRAVLEHGVETGRIVRLSGGEYVEVHAPLDADSRRRLASSMTDDSSQSSVAVS